MPCLIGIQLHRKQSARANAGGEERCSNKVYEATSIFLRKTPLQNVSAKRISAENFHAVNDFHSQGQRKIQVKPSAFISMAWHLLTKYIKSPSLSQAIEMS